MEVRCVRCNVFIGNGPVGFPSTDCPICEAEKDVELVRLSIFLQDRRARKYRKFVKEYDRLYPNRTKGEYYELDNKRINSVGYGSE